jgi:glycosyltransferase involved in cell wall biosynthesis
MSDVRILAMIDSPTLATGFAAVGQNLLPEWVSAGAQVDVWGIGFNGYGYNNWPGLRLLPAGDGGDWRSLRALEGFLRQLAMLRADGTPLYTHCFILQDTFHFGQKFCETFQHVCSKRCIRSLMYFPVDAPLEPEWTQILAAVDVPVAYTQFGKQLAEAAAAKGGLRVQCQVLPHGVNGDLFRPAPDQRAEDRRMWEVGDPKKPIVFARPEDFLLVNVNTNQWRKDLPRSLEILAELLRRGVPAKLVMHCRRVRPEGTDLESVGRQLGLQMCRDWVHAGDLFGPHDSAFMGYDKAGRALVGSLVGPGDMARMYNAADLVLSTSLGEGWGLSITEALATGTPVALPMHTSCLEIYKSLAAVDASYAQQQMVLLPADDRIVMPAEMSRVRQRVELQPAVDRIESYYRSGAYTARRELPAPAREWLSWPRIAAQMYQLLVGDGRATGRSVTPATNPQTLEVNP